MAQYNIRTGVMGLGRPAFGSNRDRLVLAAGEYGESGKQDIERSRVSVDRELEDRGVYRDSAGIRGQFGRGKRMQHGDEHEKLETEMLDERDFIYKRIEGLENLKAEYIDRVKYLEQEIRNEEDRRAQVESDLAQLWQNDTVGARTSAPAEGNVGVEYEIEFPRLELQMRLDGGHFGGISAVDYSHDTQLVALGSLDTQVSLWDSVTGNKRFMIAGHSDIVRGVQFYGDRILTSANDGRIRMWDLAMCESVRPVEPLDGFSTTPPVSPSICNHVAPIELCCEASFLGHNGAVTCFEAVDGVLLSGSADGLVREWDLNTGLLRLRFDLTWSARSLARLDSSDSLRVGTQSGDGGFIGALQFVGPALATGTADGFIRLYDRRSSQPVRSIASHSMPISSLRFNDRYIVSGSLDSSAAIWDLRALKLVQRIKFPSKVTSVSLLPSAPSNSFWFSASSSAFFNFSLLNSEFKAFDSLTGDLKLRMQNMIYDELDISKNPILLDYDHNSQKQNYFTKSHVSRLKYLDSDTLLTASETGSACIWTL